MAVNTIKFMGIQYNAGTSQLTYARQQFESDLNSSGNAQLQTDWNQRNQDSTTFTTDLKNNNIDAFNAYARVQEDNAFGASSAQTQADKSAFQGMLTSGETSEYTQLQADNQTFNSDLSSSSSQTQCDYQAFTSDRNSALTAGFQTGTIPTSLPTGSSCGSNSNGSTCSHDTGYSSGSTMQSELVQILQMLLSGQNNPSFSGYSWMNNAYGSSNPFQNQYSNYNGYQNSYEYGGYNQGYNYSQYNSPYASSYGNEYQ